MTKVVTGTVCIEETEPTQCTLCQKVRELRPYGSDGVWACFECCMKDEVEATKQFSKLFTDRDI